MRGSPCFGSWAEPNLRSCHQRAGLPPDRTRWEGWQQWRKIRGTFVPAPRLSLAEHQSLSPRRRALHDLHRTAAHVNMRLQGTPMSARVANLMRGRLQNNAVKFMPGTRDGLMINGGGFQWLRTTDHQPYYGALKPLLNSTQGNWPRRSTTTHNAVGDNQPAYVTTTVLRLTNSQADMGGWKELTGFTLLGAMQWKGSGDLLVTQTRSPIGQPEDTRKVLKSLGLRGIGQVRILDQGQPSILGFPSVSRSSQGARCRLGVAMTGRLV
ncbi:uL30 family ribosomal protein [Streptomyces sp. NPDC002130]|uniref:uL30 family ribosomal protein n=1 Tax=Streptomyces sp. NPDC002130 TaxID=3155568 RepID=UPI00332862C8